MVVRIALGIEYDGTAYNGWQRQHNGVGVQGLLEKALSKIANETIAVSCAGRTDAGVHACGQVVHFDAPAKRSIRAWLLGTNSNLPNDINVTWAQFVDADFHAQFSATARHYRYRILNRPERSSLNRNRAWWVYPRLDEKAMQAGADFLLGEHDFSAFRAAGCRANTANRDVTSLTIERDQHWITLDISANAFLQHMVRNITGTLVSVGCGNKSPQWVRQVLQSCDRRQGGIAAPAQGLTLVGVSYPSAYALPSRNAETATA